MAYVNYSECHTQIRKNAFCRHCSFRSKLCRALSSILQTKRQILHPTAYSAGNSLRDLLSTSYARSICYQFSHGRQRKQQSAKIFISLKFYEATTVTLNKTDEITQHLKSVRKSPFLAL